MARRKQSAPPRDLVRLSPKQFSAAVAFIVLLASAALFTGYIIGIRSAGKAHPDLTSRVADHDAGLGVTHEEPGDSQSKAGNETTITFYSALTKQEGSGEKAAVPGKVRKPPASVTTPPRTIDKPHKPVRGTVIQVGSYRDRGKADEFLKGLTDSGYSGSVVRADLGPRGVWFRIRLGPYDSIGEARRELSTLKEKMGIKGFLVKPGT